MMTVWADQSPYGRQLMTRPGLLLIVNTVELVWQRYKLCMRDNILKPRHNIDENNISKLSSMLCLRICLLLFHGINWYPNKSIYSTSRMQYSWMLASIAKCSRFISRWKFVNTRDPRALTVDPTILTNVYPINKIAWDYLLKKWFCQTFLCNLGFGKFNVFISWFTRLWSWKTVILSSNVEF